MYRLELRINGLPKIISNGSKGSWRSAWAEARKWHRLILEAVVFSRQKPQKPLERARLQLTRYSSVEPDFDGLAISFKHVLDALIKAGVLVNDKVSNIGQPNYRWEKTKPGGGFITITVEEIEA